jgi:hypothetical protein
MFPPGCSYGDVERFFWQKSVRTRADDLRGIDSTRESDHKARRYRPSWMALRRTPSGVCR